MELQQPRKKSIGQYKKKKKTHGLDKNNRSVSLLRYRLIFTTKDLKEIFIIEEIKQKVHQAIYNYFYPENQRREKTKLISVYVHDISVEINFQSLPTVILRQFVNNLYIYFQKHLKNLSWNSRVFLSTQRQVVKQQIENYLESN